MKRIVSFVLLCFAISSAFFVSGCGKNESNSMPEEEIEAIGDVVDRIMEIVEKKGAGTYRL